MKTKNTFNGKQFVAMYGSLIGLIALFVNICGFKTEVHDI